VYYGTKPYQEQPSQFSREQRAHVCSHLASSERGHELSPLLARRLESPSALGRSVCTLEGVALRTVSGTHYSVRHTSHNSQTTFQFTVSGERLTFVEHICT
jgi:hypothetical protein